MARKIKRCQVPQNSFSLRFLFMFLRLPPITAYAYSVCTICIVLCPVCVLCIQFQALPENHLECIFSTSFFLFCRCCCRTFLSSLWMSVCVAFFCSNAFHISTRFSCFCLSSRCFPTLRVFLRSHHPTSRPSSHSYHLYAVYCVHDVRAAFI